MKRIVAALAAAVLVAACGDEKRDGPTTVSGTCGLPTQGPNVDESIVPEAFVLPDAEIAKAKRARGRVTAIVNFPTSVQQAFDSYRRAIKESGFRIVGQDNEGFEAEIYLRKGNSLGAIQIRTSTCDDAVIVFLNILEDARAQLVPTLTPGPSPSR